MIEFINKGGVTTPLGFAANATAADVKANKKGNLDFTVLVSDEALEVSAVFTTNLVKAAPVKYDMDLLSRQSEKYGVVVNSGNANACTGGKGMKACEDITSEFERLMELPERSLFICSTGVIGNQMPVERMLAKAQELVDGVEDDKGDLFAKAIMTTDTVAKECAVIVHTDRGSYCIGASAKGAGMIDPAMATLLGFVTTDADIKADKLNKILAEVVENTFNSITIDGDRSTNDTLLVLANGMSDVPVSTDDELALFKDALTQVCKKMALAMVKDGEGATKLVTINVQGAKDSAQAKLCAAKIANSLLVKTMFAGCDPNWGRLMSTAGSSGAVFDEASVSIWFDTLHYVKNGEIVDPALEKKVYEIMKTPEYSITLDLGAGGGEAVYYTCDITKEYVAINADYRS